MERKITVAQFAISTLVAFTVMILFLTLIGPLVGGDAKEISTLFSLGSQGISYATIRQTLVMALYASIVQVVFLSNWIVKKMMLLWRTILVFFFILTGIGALSVWFRWLPLNNTVAWVAYLFSFAGACSLSTLLMVVKTRRESAQVEKKLEEYKKRRQEKSKGE